MSKCRNSENLTRFLVLFEGRSGSTFFVESLNSHPRIRAEKECFSTLKKRILKGKAPVEAQLQFLDELYADPSNRCEAVGFKTKHRDIMDAAAVAKSLQRFRVKVILLQRRNRVKLVVSLMNAIRLNEATGDWNLYNTEDRVGPITVDVDEFDAYLQKVEETREKLVGYAESLQLETLALSYEDLITAKEDTFAKTCAFLGVERRHLQAECVKNTSDDLRDVIVNYDHIRARYMGTAYAEMFDEILVRS